MSCESGDKTICCGWIGVASDTNTVMWPSLACTMNRELVWLLMAAAASDAGGADPNETCRAARGPELSLK
jgi:hypothetical protein